jgi:hypothetical protein
MLIPFGILSAAGAGVEAGPAYELIETSILTSSQSSVTFSSLGTYSSTYKHLQIRYVARGTRSATSAPVFFRFNGNTTNYFTHSMIGSGSTVASYANLNGTYMDLGLMFTATATANAFGAGVIDIFDAYSTTKNKTFRGLTGVNEVGLFSGSRADTTNISSISVHDIFGNFIAGSRFSLYGVKG